VILFDKYRVIQAETVVYSTTAKDGVLLREPQARNGLASVQNLARRTGDSGNELRCHGRRS